MHSNIGGGRPAKASRPAGTASDPSWIPTGRTFEPEPDQLAALRRYVREWLLGADPDVVTPISWTYTSTDDGNFVLEAVGPIVVGAGFSGHGFKFVPTVGRILADLVEGSVGPPAQFSLARA